MALMELTNFLPQSRYHLTFITTIILSFLALFASCSPTTAQHHRSEATNSNMTIDELTAEGTTLYFAYGSNLSPTQMLARCPDSKPLGLAHLPHPWKWLINERGYANVVDSDANAGSREEEEKAGTPAETGQVPGPGPGVYGLLFRLPPADEKLLDMYEGVPHAYNKVLLPVIVLPQADKTVEALVYVDFKRVQPGKPREEYVARMNRGIDEAAEHWGLPETYVRDVMREFI